MTKAERSDKNIAAPRPNGPPGHSEETREYATLQQQWHGWGSPVGLGVVLLCVCLGAGVLLLGIAAITAAGSNV